MAESSNSSTQAYISTNSPYHPNISKCRPTNVIKLDNSNYLAWIAQFLPMLRIHDWLEIVDGSELCHAKFPTNSINEKSLNP